MGTTLVFVSDIYRKKTIEYSNKMYHELLEKTAKFVMVNIINAKHKTPIPILVVVTNGFMV